MSRLSDTDTHTQRSARPDKSQRTALILRLDVIISAQRLSSRLRELNFRLQLHDFFSISKFIVKGIVHSEIRRSKLRDQTTGLYVWQLYSERPEVSLNHPDCGKCRNLIFKPLTHCSQQKTEGVCQCLCAHVCKVYVFDKRSSARSLLTEHYCSPHGCLKGLWETGEDTQRFTAAVGNDVIVCLGENQMYSVVWISHIMIREGLLNTILW